MKDRLDSNSQPTTIVIFGASGDLTQSKLIPVLFNLYRKGRLPANTRVVGFARRPYTHDDFRARLRDGVNRFAGGADDTTWGGFAADLWCVLGDLATPGDSKHLQAALHELEAGPVHRLYYLATAPRFYVPVIRRLGVLGMTQSADGWRHVVVEKPFGHDQTSAHVLNQAIHAAFHESQVYRIDHYLGKETAQNLLRSPSNSSAHLT